MKLTWHIIQKDLVYQRWGLGLWLLSGLALLLSSTAYFPAHVGTLADYFRVFAILTHGGLQVALIGQLAQSDDATGSTTHWRSLPISSGRMLGAKLLLLTAVFAVLPTLAICTKLLSVTGGRFNGDYRDPLLFALGVSTAYLSVTLGCAAVAACTKDLGKYLLLGLLCVMAAVALSIIGDYVAVRLGIKGAREVGLSRLIALLLFVLMVGLSVLCNQYLGRRMGLSAGLIALGVVGSALIGNFWNWKFL